MCHTARSEHHHDLVATSLMDLTDLLQAGPLKARFPLADAPAVRRPCGRITPVARQITRRTASALHLRPGLPSPYRIRNRQIQRNSFGLWFGRVSAPQLPSAIGRRKAVFAPLISGLPQNLPR